MNIELIEFFALFVLVVYSDYINRTFRRWYRLTVDPFKLKADKPIPMLTSLVLLALAFSVAFIPLWLTFWLVSSVVSLSTA